MLTNVFLLCVLIAMRTAIILLLQSDVVCADLFGTQSRLGRIELIEQNRIVHAILHALAVVLFVLYPFLQILLSMLLRAVVPQAQMNAIINTMMLLETTQVVCEYIQPESLDLRRMRENIRLKQPPPAELFWNVVVFVFYSVLADGSYVGVVHCVLCFYLCSAFTHTSVVLNSLKMLLGEDYFLKRLSKIRMEQLVLYEARIWQANRVLQVLILSQSVLSKNAKLLEWGYIFFIPLILDI